MERWKRKRESAAAVVVLLLLSLAVGMSVSSTSPVASSGGGGENEEGAGKPEPVERAMGLEGLRTRWDGLRSWAMLNLLSLRRVADSGKYASGAGDFVKEAATRSLETSREAAELAAKSAAVVVDGAVDKAKEKLQRAVSSKGHPQTDAEL